MTQKDIRWIQRLSNFSKALSKLENYLKEEKLNELEEQGLIQAFEYNFELAWNCIKDFYEHQAEIDIQGSRDAFRLAFKRGLIENGQVWMDMIKSRNQTSHTYNESTAQEIVSAIRQSYFKEFSFLHKKLHGLANKEDE